MKGTIDWKHVGIGVVLGIVLERTWRRFQRQDAPCRAIAESITDLIGNTPMVRLSRVEPEHKLIGKCEFMSVYSLKDRAVKQIIADAERDGKLDPAKGGTLIETTSGNTGMAVCSQGSAKGYRTIICMSELQSVERRRILKALGAELILTPREQGTKGAKAAMNRILEEHPEYT